MYGFLAALVVLAVTGVVALVLRRRHAPRPSLASRVEPLPAGVKHLASTVSDLSDFELHLPMVRRALAPKRRLGVLLHPR
jgi:hypothetical protein